MEPCPLCQLLRDANERRSGRFIHEFSQSLLFLGEHQYFEGYAVLVAKQHVGELYELPKPEYVGFMEELSQASRAVQEAFKPRKLNHASLGNQVPHLHWHIIPRYEHEADALLDPWRHSEDFKHALIGESEAASRVAKIRRALSQGVGA
jgi:diadenosine tetraphosphate (Ap4A) HIT family hydrolase